MTQISGISVVVPVYNDAACLRRLLAQLVRFDLVDIIVVDGGSQDDSRIYARQHNQVTLLEGCKGRGSQIALGLNAVRANIVWILHADSVVAERAVDEIQRILAQPRTVLGCFPLRFDRAHPALALFAWASRFDSPVTTFGDQGYFCRYTDLLALENIAAWPLLEDVAIRKHLLGQSRYKGGKGRVCKSSLTLTTSARRFLHHGVMRTQIINAWVILRYFCGTDPQKLYNEYYGT